MRTPTPPSVPGEVPLIDRLRAATAGRYTIHAELGAGGMATVFRATELALEREVAIKVMATAMAGSPGAWERFRREARVAAALSHPHIVPIYAIGDDPALAWFAMKFIEGRGLDAILREQGAQPIEFVTKVLGDVGRALQHAHERGVVHRDVKPANIMVGHDGWIYVTDFGIAKRDDAQGLTQQGTVIGTPAYMCPEQFEGQPVTGAADQYALGIVAYELLTGRTPFDSPSLGEVMKGHLLQAPPPLRTRRIDVPIALADVVNRMLEKDPARRFASLGEAVDALEGAASVARGPARRSAGTAAGGVPVTAAGAATAGTPAQMGATTPIPRSNPVTTSGTVRRSTSTTQPQPVAAEPKRLSTASSLVVVLLVLGAIGGGAWYALGDRMPSLPLPGAPEPVAAADDSAPNDSTAPAAAASESTVTGATAVPANSAAPVDFDAAINELQRRVAEAPVVDLVAPPDSVVIRVGSQTLETVLFVNGQQQGIVGGRGTIPVTVAPGAVSIAVRKLNCRDWDTTFTTLAGRRYTFLERSPRC